MTHGNLLLVHEGIGEINKKICYVENSVVLFVQVFCLGCSILFDSNEIDQSPIAALGGTER